MLYILYFSLIYERLNLADNLIKPHIYLEKLQWVLSLYINISILFVFSIRERIFLGRTSGSKRSKILEYRHLQWYLFFTFYSLNLIMFSFTYLQQYMRIRIQADIHIHIHSDVYIYKYLSMGKSKKLKNN